MPDESHGITEYLPLSGCAASSSAASKSSVASKGGSSNASIKMEFIGANTTNPFDIFLAQAVAAEAKKDGVNLTETAAVSPTDSASQINDLQTAVAAGVKVIIINQNGDAVNPAELAARKAGVLVLSVDDVPSPPTTVDMSFSTNNRAAGVADGKWVAAKLDGKPAIIGMIDYIGDNSNLGDIYRHQGFLEGMGIPLGNQNLKYDEPTTGKYAGGGDYTIVYCGASDGQVSLGRTAMENCLSKNPNINVVYNINEPTAEGAYAALKAAGKLKGTIIVAIDGSCAGVANVKSGEFSVDAMQFPRTMAVLAVDAGVKWVKTGVIPKATPGLTFQNSGVAVVSNSQVAGFSSLTPAQAESVCW
jgi:fructose transport system substrate-binding protein